MKFSGVSAEFGRNSVEIRKSKIRLNSIFEFSHFRIFGFVRVSVDSFAYPPKFEIRKSEIHSMNSQH